jgi:hypothetical protein
MKPRIENKDKVAKVLNKNGEVCETFTFRDHGNSYLSVAQNYLWQNYDKLMQEENLGEMKKPSKDTYRKAVVRAGDPDDERMTRSASDYAKRGAKEHGKKFGKELKTQHDSEGGFTRPWNFKRKERKEQGLDENYVDPADKHQYAVSKAVENLTNKGHKIIGRTTGEDGTRIEYKDKNGKSFEHMVRARALEENSNEDLQEVSKKTLGSYVKLAARDAANSEGEYRDNHRSEFSSERKHAYRHAARAEKRLKGIDRATDKLTKEGLQEASGGKLGKYIVAARNRENEEKKKGQEFVQQMKDAGLKGFAPPLRHKGPQKGQSSRENMIRLAVNKLTNPNFSSPVKVPATESVVLHEDAVEGFKNGIIRRMHNMTHPESGKPYMIHMLVKHGFDKVNNAINSSAEFHGDGAEEIGSSDITAATNSALRDLGEKHLEERSLTPAEQKKKEEIIMAMKRKGQEPKYGAATAVAKTVAENKIYTNVIAKIQEGRKPKEGSKAWDRQQERLKAGGVETETPHVVTQLMKHSDYGDKPHTYKFNDGSTHEVSPRQRDKVLAKLRSMTGPGKKPEDREKLYHEVNTAKGFFHHTGDKPMEPEKRHPMSLQK